MYAVLGGLLEKEPLAYISFIVLAGTQVAPIESKVTLFYPLSTMVDAGQILDSKKGGNALYHLDAGSTVYRYQGYGLTFWYQDTHPTHTHHNHTLSSSLVP